MSYQTPILFLVFNRPDLTKRVLKEISLIKPTNFYIAIDGPREDKIGEIEKCNEVKQIIKEGVNWPCNLKLLVREYNLGCGIAVSTAIDWFFDNEDEGIILEDDCLPLPIFFNFCEEILNKYRYNNKITHISGNNFQCGIQRGNADYYFSEYTHIWGWATWKRAWQKYNYEMTGYSSEYINENNVKITNRLSKKFLDEVYHKNINTWDVQWFYTNFINNSLAIIPNTNLIKNIGFNEDATHTIDTPSYIDKLIYKPLNLPIQHPELLAVDIAADIYTSKHIFGINNKKNIFKRVINKLIRILKNL